MLFTLQSETSTAACPTCPTGLGLAFKLIFEAGRIDISVLRMMLSVAVVNGLLSEIFEANIVNGCGCCLMRNYHLLISLTNPITPHTPRTLFDKLPLPSHNPQPTSTHKPTLRGRDYREGALRIDWVDFEREMNAKAKEREKGREEEQVKGVLQWVLL
jgi:hypothetical protein